MSTLCKTCLECICQPQSIFADVEANLINSIDQNRTVNHYKKGQALFYQGNPAFGVFCINTGKIKLVKSDNLGNESIVRLANPGDLLGHDGVLTDELNYASAVALEKSSACFFDKKIILKIITNSSPVSLRLIKTLSTSLRLADLHTASKSQQSVREKFASLLLGLMVTNGVTVGEHCQLDIKLSREEFASIIGSSLETISRLISELKAEGILQESEKIIFITNKIKLKAFTNQN